MKCVEYILKYAAKHCNKVAQLKINEYWSFKNLALKCIDYILILQKENKK